MRSRRRGPRREPVRSGCVKLFPGRRTAACIRADFRFLSGRGADPSTAPVRAFALRDGAMVAGRLSDPEAAARTVKHGVDMLVAAG